MRPFVFIFLSAVLWIGCERPAPQSLPVLEPQTSDSAGVRIVFNTGPRFLEGDFWKLSDEPTVRIDGMDGSDSNILLDPAAVFRTPSNRIIVADGLSNGWDEVLVFSRRGRFLESLGRAGSGPCEFRQLWWAGPYRGDSIAAYDYSDHVVAIFGPDGECGREVRLPHVTREIPAGTYGFSPGLEGVFPDGGFLVSSRGSVDLGEGAGEKWYRHTLLHVSPEGMVVDSIGDFGILTVRWTGDEQQEMPFQANGLKAITGDRFFYGEGGTFEVNEYDRKGILRRSVRWSGDREPVTDVDVADFENWYRSMNTASREAAPSDRFEAYLASLEPPSFKPVSSGLLVDAEGNLWIKKYDWVDQWGRPSDLSPGRWRVFSPSGVWLGTVDTPPGFDLKSVGSDYVLGLIQDDMDVRHVRMFDLIKE